MSRSDKTKHCPPGFEPLGKECVQVVTVPSIQQCQPGSEMTPEGVCAVFSNKVPQCAEGFTRLGNNCEHKESVTPFSVCGEGHTLNEDGECSMPIETPPVEECVGGSVRKGDLCLVEEEREPELTCPPGYTLNGKRCRIVEMYNCTPPRPTPTQQPGAGNFPTPPPSAAIPLPPAEVEPLPVEPYAAPPMDMQQAAYAAPAPPPVQSYTAPPPVQSYTAPPPVQSYTAQPPMLPPMTAPPQFPARGSRVFHGKSSYPGEYPPVSGYRRMQRSRPSKEFVPELVDYVVQATCKRIRTILAQKVCTTGVLVGKTCRVEVEVPPVLITQNSFENDIQEPEPKCPNGFSIVSRDLCQLLQIRKVDFVCPEGTQDIGDRCASYAPPTITCPTGFALENDETCVQTLHQPPIVEFSVKFSCTGKDCQQP